MAEPRRMIIRLLLIASIGAGLAMCAPRDATSTARQANPPEIDPSKPYRSVEHYTLLDFQASWPAEVSATPSFASKIAAEIEIERKRWREIGRAHYQDGYRFKPGVRENRYFKLDYRTAGLSERLLSVVGHLQHSDGGVFDINRALARMWDRSEDREVRFDQLYNTKTAFRRSLDPLACRALWIAARRDGATYFHYDFEDCARMLEFIVIAPEDRDGNGRFERLALSLNAYNIDRFNNSIHVADVPVTSQLIEELQPKFRSSFEVVPGSGRSPDIPAPAVTLKMSNDLIEIDVSWSREANAEPELVRLFHRQFEQEQEELAPGAREDRASVHDSVHMPFLRHGSSTVILTAGVSSRLLSLSRSYGDYRGGPSARLLSDGILWDRAQRKQLGFAELLANPSALEPLLGKRWCDARTRHWGRELEDCPSIADIAIVPEDEDGDGRFEQLTIAVSDYIDGPSGYSVVLPVTPDLIASMKAEYRGSFEVPAQPQ